jgi:hypothetical protein
MVAAKRGAGEHRGVEGIPGTPFSMPRYVHLQRGSAMSKDSDNLDKQLEQLTDNNDLTRRVAEIVAVCPLCLNPDSATCGC